MPRVAIGDYLGDTVCSPMDVGTTPEHSFYVIGKGWIKAGQLKAGDPIAGLEASQVRQVHSVLQATE